jgi:hypothetical protein
VNGLAGRLNLIRLVGSQPVIVLLQVFNHALKVTHTRSQSSTLHQKTVIRVHTLTQQRFGHTNSEKILRACEG